MKWRRAARDTATRHGPDPEPQSPPPLIQAALWALAAVGVVLYGAPVVLPWLEGKIAIPEWLIPLR